jgi:hypothetical protein
MAPLAQVTQFAFKSILEKDKLNGTNFTTWYRNLRIVLKHDKKEQILEDPLPEEPTANANAIARNAYQKLVDETNEISCLMLACMEPTLQQHFEDVGAFDMIESLKSMFLV